VSLTAVAAFSTQDVGQAQAQKLLPFALVQTNTASARAMFGHAPEASTDTRIAAGTKRIADSPLQANGRGARK
jgi:hypothetical protein